MQTPPGQQSADLPLCHVSPASLQHHNSIWHSESAGLLKHHTAPSGHRTEKHYLEEYGLRASVQTSICCSRRRLVTSCRLTSPSVPISMWCLHCGPLTCVWPPSGRPVGARWWLVWVSMGLFTHYRPHRQDTVKTAYVCHVCLNYRQAMTGQLLCTTATHGRECKIQAFLQKLYWLFLALLL